MNEKVQCPCKHTKKDLPAFDIHYGQAQKQPLATRRAALLWSNLITYYLRFYRYKNPK